MGVTHFLWLDLETTGTDEHHDPILEIAAVLTRVEAPWREIDTRDYVIGDGLPVDWMARMDGVVRPMHTENGLIEEVLLSPWSIADAEARVLGMLSDHGVSKHHVMLAGSGVAHFDRRFLRRYTPELEAYLTYPVFDVGVMRRAMVFAGRPDLIPNTGDYRGKPHRALADTQLHLAEWRAYASMIFAQP